MAWLSLLSSALPGWGPVLHNPVPCFLFCFSLLSGELNPVLEGERESDASERELHQWGRQRLVLKIFFCLPLSYSQKNSKALPVSMQELAWDAGTRRMLSDPKVLSCKAVHGNVCMSVWGGPKHKSILLVL